MRRLIAIALVLLGVLACKQLDVPTLQASAKSEIVDLHKEQVACNHHNNCDAESPTSVVVPSVQIRTLSGSRTYTYRAPHITTTGHYHTTSNYVVAQFVHRLGSLARAVDFYLYTLCQLRL